MGHFTPQKAQNFSRSFRNCSSAFKSSSYILILTKHLVNIYQQIRQPFPKTAKYCYCRFLGIGTEEYKSNSA